MTSILPPALSSTGPAAALRRAVEADPARGGPPPEFSPDGGVTVFDPQGRSARLQPLGLRTRVTLAALDGSVTEAEVDGRVFIADISTHRGTYGAAESALDRENRPRVR